MAKPAPEESLLDWFYNTFKGNQSFFVKHQPPFTEKEGKLKAAWSLFAEYNKHSPPPEGKEYGDLIPVTKELYREHLNGGDGLALAPITNTKDANNVCFYAAVDIDAHGADYTGLVGRMYGCGFKFAACLSKSGGLHIYFFFEEAEPAGDVIKALEEVSGVFGLEKLYGKVEIFPKQASFVPGTSNASCLFLPFYNSANKSRQNLLTAEGKLLGIKKARAVIENMFTTLAELNAALGALPYGDAPCCVQAVLLSGALGEGDRRNEFLFFASIFLKKKYKDNFKDYLEEMNNRLAAPLERKEIDSIYSSVTKKGYDNYPCKNKPCADYCNKKLCALREFGAGRKRNNHFTGADCWGSLSKVMAKEPYYIWEVRVRPEDPFKPVRVDSVDDLQNQAAMQKRCWRDLNWAPFRVKDNDWINTVNEAMEGIEEREIPVQEQTDTSEMGQLHLLFVRYLAHRPGQDGQPYMIPFGQVYRGGGYYYFSTEGFTDFLHAKKFSLSKINLRELLISYGCCDGEVAYKTAKGEEKIVKCWKKGVDAELLAEGSLYEDVYDGDAEIIRNMKLDNESEEGGGDAKF
jgi:hypothetical protein